MILEPRHAGPSFCYEKLFTLFKLFKFVVCYCAMLINMETMMTLFLTSEQYLKCTL